MSKTTETAQEKVRVYILAKELKLDSKDLLHICQELGYSGIKNQLSGLEPDQVLALKKRVKEGPKQAAPPRPAPGPMPAVSGPPKTLTPNRVPTLAAPKPKAPTPTPLAPPAPSAVEPPVAVEPPAAVAPPEPVAQPEPVAPTVVEQTPALPEAPKAPEPPPIAAGPPPASVLPTTGVPVSRGMPNLSTNRRPEIRAAGGRPATHGPIQARPATPAPAAVAPPPPAPVVPLTPVAVVPPPVPTVVAPVPAVEPEVVVAAPAAPVSPPPAPVVPPPPPVVTNPIPTRIGPPPSIGPVRPIPSGNPNPQRSNPSTPTPTRVGPPSGNPASGSRNPNQPRFGPEGRIAPPQSSGPAGAANPQRPAPPTSAKAPPPGGSGSASKSIKLTPEQIKKMREMEQKRGKMSITEIAKQVAPGTGDAPTPPAEKGGSERRTNPPPRPGAPGRGQAAPVEEEGGKGKGATGAVVGREGRHARRQTSGRGSGPTDKGSVIISGGQVELSEQKFGSRKGPREALRLKLKRQQQQVAVKKEGPVEITLPITVRSLSEAIGVKLGDLSKQLLKETQKLYAASSVVDFDVAELIAINKGITLVQKKVKTAKDLLLERFKEQSENVDIEKLVQRPPIVVIMGHVDHGKTSLLDKIRQEYGLSSDVVSTEAGGITQVLRAWRVEKDGKPVTFLDTPGHEAFTKMRARGANVTDIAVIVVAATDGVMPQTEEAIAHARAADVDIIVAINKIDMPNANLDKTRRQLYSLNLLPDNMGGEIQFVETSAVTGQGIGELLDAIGIVAELSDPPLVADPGHKPSGTCLEAYMDGDAGVMATLLVQQGTLRKGDVILCGASFGRVRAMFDDLGRPVEEAGPSTPVKVFGLDEVPDADDPFYFVDELTEAAEIADKEREMIRERSLTNMGPKSLDQLKEAHARQKITELKVILKAEARGSVEAIRKELEKLIHEEVRCRVLFAGIGAISEADITLALTSPADTLVIGFNVTADDEALRISEERGISLREYQIIYNLVDDVKAALEGRLKPIEEVVHLGRAVIRETFKVSKVGTIAGCYVTSGVIERSAKVRVIRGGTIVYPPAERVASLDSLKRFKDDAKDVREGFECGMKISGFDDVKVDDVIEAYRIEIKQRTL